MDGDRLGKYKMSVFGNGPPPEARRGASSDPTLPSYSDGEMANGREDEKINQLCSACRPLIEGIGDGLLLIDAARKIADFNYRALGILGRGAAQLWGAKLVELLGDGGEEFVREIEHRLEKSPHICVEHELVRGNGAAFPAEIVVGRTHLEPYAQWCLLFRDIAARKRAQEALEEAVARLEQHDQARLQFISNVSHELRTPLTSMIYAVNNMLAGVVGPLPERAVRYLEIIEGDCKRLLATVNDILDLRKLETKTLALKRQKVPVVPLVNRSIESLLVQAHQKSQSISVLPEHGRWFVDCDPQRMERVIINVVGNAIKFTPEGGTIEITIGDDADRSDHVVISVRDNGIGIPAEALGKVTMRYFTVGEQASGAGLGLAISKEIVVLHGGKLEINSPPPGFDKGTVVRISLPLTQPPGVLVVDDDENMLDLLAEQIGRDGYRIWRARTVAEAETIVAKERPAVVVLDLVLPDADGTEFILKTRSEKKTPPVAIIVVTGEAISASKAEVLSSFSIPNLRKPWQEADLMEAIADVFIGHSALGRRVL